jgi:hypothetical protein
MFMRSRAAAVAGEHGHRASDVLADASAAAAAASLRATFLTNGEGSAHPPR